MSTQASVEIVLEYRRVGEYSTGELYARSTEKGKCELTKFESIGFDAMLYMLAKNIAPHPDAVVYLVRSDRPGSAPYKLDPSTLTLLREDPVAMVQAFTVPGSPSTLLMRARQEGKPRMPMLRAGFDVLADAFGELVYARYIDEAARFAPGVRFSELECPGCGFWSPIVGVFECIKRCRIKLAVTLSDRWGAVSIPHLLATNVREFYLPRAWNHGDWIDRDELQKKYEDFISEREAALCSKMDPL